MTAVEAGLGALAHSAKRIGYDWYRSVGSPRYFVAPMVGHSHLAYRLLTREYGAQMTVTPMIHAKRFLNSPNLRKSYFDAWDQDYPLTVQFCANDPEELVEAAKLVQHACAAVDINLGCPQGIAKKGFYGAFLLEHKDLVASMVARCAEELTVPVTVKIRLSPDLQETFAFVDAMVAAGASLLTVHGRTRYENKTLARSADWEAIKAIKERLPIPVVANGGLFDQGDIARCMVATGVDGVMLSEAVLENPGVFSRNVHLPTGSTHNAFDMAWRYLEIAEAVGTERKHVQGHTLKMLHGGLCLHPDLHKALPGVHTGDVFQHTRGIVRELASRFHATLVDIPPQHALVAATSSTGARVLANARAAAKAAYMGAMPDHRHTHMGAEDLAQRTAAVEAAAAEVMEGGQVVAPLLPLPFDPALAAAQLALPPVPLSGEEVPGAQALGARASAVALADAAGAPSGAMLEAARTVPAATGPRPLLMREIVARASGNLEQKAAMELQCPTDIAFPKPGMWYYRHAARVVAAALSPCSTVAEAMLDIALQRSGRFRTHVVRDVSALKVYLRAKHGTALGLSPAPAAPTAGTSSRAHFSTAAVPASYATPLLPRGAPFQHLDGARAAAAKWWAAPPDLRIPSDLMAQLVQEMVPLPMMDAEEAAALAAGEVTVEELGGVGTGTGTAILDQPAGELEALNTGVEHLFGADDAEFEEE